jgi:hypothetical protein
MTQYLALCASSSRRWISLFEIAVAEDLREIGPGLWFPFRMRFTDVDGAAIKEGLVETAWTSEYRVEKELNPNYDIWSRSSSNTA